MFNFKFKTMKKRLSFVIIAVVFFSNFIKAEDIILGDTCITIGYGWGSTFFHDTTNPGPATGVGCNAAKVTKVVTSGWGSFGLQKLPAIDWTKYDKIEMLVYPEKATTFKTQVAYKGWATAVTTTSILDNKVGTGTALALKQWQVLTINLDGPLYNADSSKIYTSLSDITFNVNTIQLYMGCASNIMDIGTITLKEKAANFIDEKQLSSINITPNPATTNITISNEGIENAKIIISTITGIDVLLVKADANNTTIDVSSLSAGIYIVSIITPQGTQSQKLIIK